MQRQVLYRTNDKSERLIVKRRELTDYLRKNYNIGIEDMGNTWRVVIKVLDKTFEINVRKTQARMRESLISHPVTGDLIKTPILAMRIEQQLRTWRKGIYDELKKRGVVIPEEYNKQQKTENYPRLFQYHQMDVVPLRDLLKSPQFREFLKESPRATMYALRIIYGDAESLQAQATLNQEENILYRQATLLGDYIAKNYGVSIAKSGIINVIEKSLERLKDKKYISEDEIEELIQKLGVLDLNRLTLLKIYLDNIEALSRIETELDSRTPKHEKQFNNLRKFIKRELKDLGLDTSEEHLRSKITRTDEIILYNFLISEKMNDILNVIWKMIKALSLKNWGEKEVENIMRIGTRGNTVLVLYRDGSYTLYNMNNLLEPVIINTRSLIDALYEIRYEIYGYTNDKVIWIAVSEDKSSIILIGEDEKGNIYLYTDENGWTKVDNTVSLYHKLLEILPKKGGWISDNIPPQFEYFHYNNMSFLVIDKIGKGGFVIHQLSNGLYVYKSFNDKLIVGKSYKEVIEEYLKDPLKYTPPDTNVFGDIISVLEEEGFKVPTIIKILDFLNKKKFYLNVESIERDEEGRYSIMFKPEEYYPYIASIRPKEEVLEEYKDEGLERLYMRNFSYKNLTIRKGDDVLRIDRSIYALAKHSKEMYIKDLSVLTFVYGEYAIEVKFPL